MHSDLHPEEIQTARILWRDLKYGNLDAHENLKNAPEHIRQVVLAALLAAMKKGVTEDDPFTN